MTGRIGLKVVVNLETLSVGKLFDGRKLVISISPNRIEAVQREPGAANIDFFTYDVFGNDVHYKGGSKITPSEPHYYSVYMKKLMEAGQWR